MSIAADILESMQPTIRPATDSDRDAVLSLLQIMRTHGVNEQAFERYLGTIIADPMRDVLLVDTGDSIPGMVVVNAIFKLDLCEVHIDEVVVNEAARGKGYGKLLVAAAEDWAWQHEADFVELTSSPKKLQRITYTDLLATSSVRPMSTRRNGSHSDGSS